MVFDVETVNISRFAQASLPSSGLTTIPVRDRDVPTRPTTTRRIPSGAIHAQRGSPTRYSECRHGRLPGGRRIAGMSFSPAQAAEYVTTAHVTVANIESTLLLNEALSGTCAACAQ